MNDTMEVAQRPTLLRVPENDLLLLKRLAQATRVSQSTYLREAIGDLLEKYAHLFAATASVEKE